MNRGQRRVHLKESSLQEWSLQTFLVFIIDSWQKKWDRLIFSFNHCSCFLWQQNTMQTAMHILLEKHKNSPENSKMIYKGSQVLENKPNNSSLLSSSVQPVEENLQNLMWKKGSQRHMAEKRQCQEETNRLVKVEIKQFQHWNYA